jgi:hypothetical protein
VESAIVGSERRGLGLGSIVFVLSLAMARVAHAEPTPQEKETARALMDQGDERFEQKNYAGALEAYAGAHAIMRVPTTAIEVAKAHEKLGHLVEARDALLEAVRYPKSPSEPAAYSSARADAEQQALALGDRIPAVLVRIDGAPKDAVMQVTVDRVVLPPPAAKLPLNVNPGRHHIVVTSEDTTQAESDVDVVERETKTVSVRVAPRPRASGPAPVAETASPLKTIGVVSAGAGITGMIVGTVFGLSASSQQSDAGCPNNVCRDDASAEKLRDANSAATASNVAFAIGGALTIAGVTLWLLAPKGSRKTAIVVPSVLNGRF